MSVNDVIKGMINTELQKHIAIKTEGLELQRSTLEIERSISKEESQRANAEAQRANAESQRANAEAQMARNNLTAAILAKRRAEELELEKEVAIDYYKNLLSRPMHEIAAKNGDFKKTYEEQQRLMAEWMVSQKAFKELAIQFGQKLGKTPQEVIQEGLDKEIDVLENKHNPEHKTIVGDSTIIAPHVEHLKTKYHNERKPKA